jgi:hypothetical protein
MSNSAAVPSIDPAAKVQVDHEMSLEWRSARWRLAVPATLGVLSLVLAFVQMPVALYEKFGAAGGEFGVYLSLFGALATAVVAVRTAQVRPLERFEKVLVGGAALWLLCGVVVAVLLGTIGGW